MKTYLEGEVLAPGKRMIMYQTLCDNDRTRMNEWTSIFTHEMFHVFGIAHMQTRSDRDNYIEVLDRNILPADRVQYKKCPNCAIYGPYQCNSITHYPQGLFASRPGLDTMRSKRSNCRLKTDQGTWGTPTRLDYAAVRYVCGCPNNESRARR